MDFKKRYMLSLLGLLFAFSMGAHVSPLHNSPNNNTPSSGSGDDIANFRSDCGKPNAQIDQQINNVRARLTTGGDVWWDRADGKYVVPKPTQAGDAEVSSIFAGGVWIGGFQDANAKVAAQQYGNGNSNRRDFWTGPLNPSLDDPTLRGTTADSICTDWDRFWTVTAAEIEEHLTSYQEAADAGEEYDPANIPLGVKGWPGKGNPFFFEINNFELPNTDQGLGAFYDNDGDDEYDPTKGDYPVIEIEGCDAPQYPDEMFFWIYNDAGNVHTESNGDAIKMEIQVQSFAYATNDALNNMTFQRYKLINRASIPIDSTFFAMWVDADLGCYTDDYVGCDTTRSLAYYYNVDAEDGTVGTVCDGGVATYGTTIPALGIDYFRGPKEPIFNDVTGVVDTTIELGMSSFTYFNNPGQGSPPAAEQDPNTVLEYYNYLSGRWRDGSPFTEGGNGYGGTEPINYVFPDPPNDASGWSMCTTPEDNNPAYDRRTVQASGPFTLLPGAVNELIIGAVWTPDMNYPCPDLSRLFAADDLAQNLFNSCFAIVNGPDAPDMDIIELDRELVLVLTNNAPSNNVNEEYEELDLKAPELPGIDKTYNFEGYKIYQLIDGFVTAQEYDNPDKARLIEQVDVKNGVTDIYNWTAQDDLPDFISNPIFTANEVGGGSDNGIKHTFVVKNDLFSTGYDNRLVNQDKYYFSVVSYAYNNFQDFDPVLAEGQSVAYLTGRRNIKTYTAIPRPITDRGLQADYGDGVSISRLDGVGNGGSFLDLTDECNEQVVNSSSFNDGGRFGEPLVYQEGKGPIDVKIYNPLDVKDGNFKLEINDLSTWTITRGEEVVATSEKSIDFLNEQIIGDYGFSVSIGQVDPTGTAGSGANGAIGSEETYSGTNAQTWFAGIPNRGGDLINGPAFLSNFLNFVAGDDIEANDKDRSLINIGAGFIPYRLTEYRTAPYAPIGNISPAWQKNTNNVVRLSQSLGDLNNVNIVFTSDKSKWSRCVVVETAATGTDVGIPTVGDAENMKLRQSPSIGLDAAADGTPQPDGDGVGMSYFPGYAIDVETGQRLNIFFGENSRYSCENLPCDALSQPLTGADMMYNPTTDGFYPPADLSQTTAFNMLLGGHHFVYVTKQPYDGCATLRGQFSGSSSGFVNALKNVTWCAVTTTNTPFKSYADGLIPSDVTIKLRVDAPYANAEGVESEIGENPTYEFSISGKQSTELDEAGIESQLDMINVVPNPYYGYSDYEGRATDNIVKITNLPAKCIVTIYSLDGKFIRRYNRDETGQSPVGTGISQTQIIPQIDWDLKNSKNIPVAGGVYLIHIDAEGLGERVIKWFGTNRQLDPSNL